MPGQTTTVSPGAASATASSIVEYPADGHCPKSSSTTKVAEARAVPRPTTSATAPATRTAATDPCFFSTDGECHTFALNAPDLAANNRNPGYAPAGMAVRLVGWGLA